MGAPLGTETASIPISANAITSNSPSTITIERSIFNLSKLKKVLALPS